MARLHMRWQPGQSAAVSGGVIGPPPGCGPADDNLTAGTDFWAYTGTGWQRSFGAAKSNGADHFTTVVNDVATFTFIGTSVTWVGATDFNYGKIEVKLDGSIVATIDCYSAARVEQVTLYASPAMISGSHTLALRCTGVQNAASAGPGFSVDGSFVCPAPPAVTPGAPTLPGAVAGVKQATVSWTIPTNDGGTPIVDYTAVATPGGASATVTGATATTVVVPGLLDGTSYTFVISARNGVGTGAPSVPTAAVTTLSATPIQIDAGGDSVGAWAPDSATSPSTFLMSGENAAQVAVVTNVIDMTDPSVPAGTPQSVLQSERFASANTVGYDIAVTPGTCTVQLYFAENYGPAQVAGGRVMNISINGVLVDANYETWSSLGGTVAANSKAQVRTYTVVTSGALSIRIVNTGAVGSNSPHVMGVYVVPPYAAPAAPNPPTGVSATAGNATATVNWTVPFNNNSTITNYTVTPFIGGVAQPSTNVVGANANSVVVSGLANGTTYTFKVSATNGAGTSSPSAASNSVIPTAVTAAGLLFNTIGSGRKPAAEIAAFGAPTLTFTGGILTILSNNAVVNGHYAFNAGTYTGTWTRKSGQILWGTSSTPNTVIFDGGGTVTQALNGSDTGTTVTNLTVQNYNPAHLVAAVDNTVSTNATYDYLTVRNNAEEGISMGAGGLLTNSILNNNTNVGIGTGNVNNDPHGQPFPNLIFTVRNCEIFANGTNSQVGPGLDAANVKVLFTNGATFDHCFIHDSAGGFGLWFDAYNTNAVVSFCIVKGSVMGGIFQEIGHGIKIHDNIVTGNHPFSEPGFNVGAAAIAISSSTNSEIFNNQVGSSADVIIGYVGHPGVPVGSMSVHDNTVLDLPAWGPQAGQDAGTADSHWFNNTYPVGQKFHWNGAVNLTLAQFQALGQG